VKRIGYARVSTVEQNLDMQVSALRESGCGEIFSDQGISGADFQRPGLKKAIRHLEAGDMLVVWRLDRLGRSLVDLIATINRLSARRCEFRSLTEAMDTSTSGGRLLFHMMGAMAEFERAIISERTKAGMLAAKARGVQIGRRPSMSPQQIDQALRSVDGGSESLTTAASIYGVHPKTLNRVLRSARAEVLPMK
jgi:DNA invertase Pin-like site-specific DNA recombinase